MTRESELAAELQAARGAEDQWGDQESDIIVASRNSEVVSFRLPSDELDRLETAAANAKESISEYVRGALMLRMSGASAFSPGIDLMAGMGSFVWLVEPKVSRRSSAEVTEDIPDFPPLGASA